MCMAEACDKDAKKVRYVTWFQDKNTLHKAEFIWYNNYMV
jgi:hypothetical protein